ncbi:enolase 4 [Dunckerocampus dactyliophorus]|uniref:enolase 4 n=1 Tax=Dunckerocampus dactyliophorus TaxID=161453 RepID=UPI002404DD4C|nr:enolase 4 [Dunckerocampus dactyliophorus]
MSYLVNCLSEEDQEFHHIKNTAADFYRANRVPEELEAALGEAFFQNPEDVYGYLANHFTKLSSAPLISRLNGKDVYDSKGQLCVEAEIVCVVSNKETRICSAAIASQIGQKETGVDWQANTEEREHHVMTAVQWITEPLSKMLEKQNPCDQSEVDQKLSEFFIARDLEEKEIRNKEEEIVSVPEQEVEIPASPPEKKKDKKKKKANVSEKPFCPAEPPEPVLPGCLAIGSVSLAVAKAGAQVNAIPLYKYIRILKNPEDQDNFHIPVSLVTLLSCGKTSPGKLKLLEEVILIPKAGHRVKQIITMAMQLQQEMMRIMNTSSKSGAIQAILSDSGVVPLNFDRPEQALDLISEACNNLELSLGTEIHLAVNCAAHDLMDYVKEKYEIATGVFKSPDDLVAMYQTLVNKYAAVVALIDPFRREDPDQWEKLSNVMGDSCSLLSDITYKPQAPPLPGVRGRFLKHINEITISDLIHIAAEEQGSLIFGTVSNEACSEDSMADIAVALGVDYVNLGGLRSAERMTKYNRLACIEEELAQQGRLVSKQAHPPPLFAETTQEEE